MNIVKDMFIIMLMLFTLYSIYIYNSNDNIPDYKEYKAIDNDSVYNYMIPNDIVDTNNDMIKIDNNGVVYEF